MARRPVIDMEPRGDERRLLVALPPTIATHRATSLLLSGYFGARVSRMELLLDGEHVPIRAILPPSGTRPGRFWATLDLSAGASRHAPLTLRTKLLPDGEAWTDLGELRLDPRPPGSLFDVSRPEASAGPWVAICMTTWNPTPALLEAQIESLRRQIWKRWVCLISDDASAPEGVAAIRSAIGRDRRFTLSVSPERLGVFRNFERVLSGVPSWCRVVALCDQDDRWGPQKLSTLVPDVLDRGGLVSSDARVTDADGLVLSPTLWLQRRRRRMDTRSLIVTNTLLGATAVFDATILEVALPFPSTIRDANHDHWLALVASVLGGVRDVPVPLMDYVQHSGNAVGHVGADTPQTFRLSRAEIVGLCRRPGFRHDYVAAMVDTAMRPEAYARVLARRLADARPQVVARDLDRFVSRVGRRRAVLDYALQSVRRYRADDIAGTEVAMLLGSALARYAQVGSSSTSRTGQVAPPSLRL